jgi:hypothetical protein
MEYTNSFESSDKINLDAELIIKGFTCQLPKDYNVIFDIICHIIPSKYHNIEGSELIRMLDDIEYFLKLKNSRVGIYESFKDDVLLSLLINDDNCKKAELCFQWLNLGLKYNATLIIKCHDFIKNATV